jgi:uncharacterized membrane protein
MTIKNPVEYSVDWFRNAAVAAGHVGEDVRRAEERDAQTRPLAIRHIFPEDLVEALVMGWRDFAASRTDILFVCAIYPVVGLVFARMAYGHDMLPLIFPLASGFALVGPFAAVGLYELSRRRERGEPAALADAFGVVRSSAFGSILMLGLVMVGLLVLWMLSAQAIYEGTLGPKPPASLGSFVDAVFTTGPGWTMIALGMGVGFLFAVVALCIGVVSFPLLLDRNVGLERAVWTSVRAVAANPRVMAQWGLIVAGGLVLGMIPAFLGLIVLMPLLGHATWHLYRRVIV